MTDYVSAEFIVLGHSERPISKYLQYLLNSPEFLSFAIQLGIGDRPRIKYEQIAEYPVKLPPLNEQNGIVAEIEKQFSRLEAGTSSLLNVQKNLIRYRSSVYKSAGEGNLVQNEFELVKSEPESYESGEDLLRRILASTLEGSLFSDELLELSMSQPN